MNPYLQIAREHCTLEELEMLVAEKKRPTPKTMTPEQELRDKLRKRIQKSF